MATKKQAWALYRRFFPEARFAHVVAQAECAETTGQDQGLSKADEKSFGDKNHPCLSELASLFAESVPEDEFSTAELQGYLLTCKMKPLDAITGIAEWIHHERTEKRQRDERERQRKEKLRESRLKAKTAMVVDLVGPLQQRKTVTQAEGAAESSVHSILPSDTSNDIVTSSTRPMIAQLDAGGPDPSNPIHFTSAMVDP